MLSCGIDAGPEVTFRRNAVLAPSALGARHRPSPIRGLSPPPPPSRFWVVIANRAAGTPGREDPDLHTTTDGLAESRDVRAPYLPDEPPASTAVRVAALMVPDGLIEVDVVAVIPAGG